MKIPLSVRELYASMGDDVRLLSMHADDVLGRFATERGWFYLSRTKTLESFSLKLETGRVANPAEMDDLFAATIVVLNRSQVEPAAAAVATELGAAIVNRKPVSPDSTTKYPESFRFDDLRLYLRFTQPKGLPPRQFFNRVFELQVKTLLQHAWTTATHDVIYKGTHVSWGRERVGFQTRAILEHVEDAIAVLESYERVVAFPEYGPYSVQNSVMVVLSGAWDESRLPRDIRRLTETIADLLSALRLTPIDLQRALDAACSRGEGAAALDLAPYQAVVMALFDELPDSFKRLAHPRSRIKVLATRELTEARPTLPSVVGNGVIQV